MIDLDKVKFLGPAFILFEAVMHVYLVAYLVLEKASIPAIGFTIFELVMFIYLLVERKLRKKKNAKKN